MEMGMAIRGPSVDDPDTSCRIITEFKRSIQGFMVKKVVANRSIPKFSSDKLVKELLPLVAATGQQTETA